MGDDSVMRTRATLVILSEVLSVDEIVSAVALTPDWTAERGTPVTGGSGNLRKYTAVAVQSGLAPDAPVSAHADVLLNRVSEAKDEIRALAGAAVPPESRGVPVSFSLNVESSDGMFGFGLSAGQLLAIAELGAHLGVEVAVDKDFAQG